MDGKYDRWAGRLGVILAVAGSAIGFGNFLRFPGLAAQYGGDAFMIAYFCAFLLLGVPLSWLEWSIGRRGGALGGHSCSGIFYLLTRSRVWKYLGVLGILAPLGVAFYYVYLESWTLGYAYHCLVGDLNLGSSDAFGQFFNTFTGAAEDGAAFRLSESGVLLCFIISLGLNLYLLYRGVSRGIEWFCKVSMPVLLVTALVILLRVLTLGTPDATHPERSVEHGLGYMWNPDKTELQVRSEDSEWTAAVQQEGLPSEPDPDPDPADTASDEDAFAAHMATVVRRIEAAPTPSPAGTSAADPSRFSTVRVKARRNGRTRTIKLRLKAPAPQRLRQRGGDIIDLPKEEKK